MAYMTLYLRQYTVKLTFKVSYIKSTYVRCLVNGNRLGYKTKVFKLLHKS